MEPSTPPAPTPPTPDAQQVLADAVRDRDRQLEAMRQRLANTENNARETLITAELSTSLGDFTFISPAAREQTMALLRREVVVDSGPDGVSLKSPSYGSFSEHVKQRMTTPDFQHFLSPGHQGGTGNATGAHRQPPASGTPAPAMTAAEFNALSFGQKAMMASKVLTEERRGELANTPASLDMRQPFGLPSRRRSG